MKQVISYTVLGVLSLILLIALNASQRRTAAAELALAEGTLAAITEASAELDTLTLCMDKLLVTTSVRQSVKLLSQIVLSADRTQTSLAALPDEKGQQSAILAYLSRLGHRSEVYLADMIEGDGLPTESRAELSAMLSDLRLLQAELTLAQTDLLAGLPISSALPETEVTAPPSAQELISYKALPSTEISSGEAMQIAKEFIGTDRVLSVQHAPDTSGTLPTFGVSVQTSDVQLNVEVTQRGGKVLLMAPETASFQMFFSPEECSKAALSFLQSRGFPAVETPWYQVYDGLCVLTCVYVQNGVLIWPDRILVQVRMDTAEVVGIEARNYWKNHIPRKLQSPLLTETEARAFLSPDATVTAVRLCLLPANNQERLCWQFTINHADESFISYIDAMTGEELLLEKIIQFDFGSTAA